MDTAETRLRNSFFVVEATSFEQFVLWEKYCKDSQTVVARRPMKWEQVNPGWLVEVGKIGKRPCCISVSWYRIDGRLVMFWYGCSQVTDSEAAENWIKKHFKGTWDRGTRTAWNDAQNFHHCVDAINEANDG